MPTAATDQLAQYVFDAEDQNERRKIVFERLKKAKLSKATRQIGFGLLGLDEKGEPISNVRRRGGRRRGQDDLGLAKLKPADRLKLLTALCGAAAQPFADAMAWRERSERRLISRSYYSTTPLRRTRPRTESHADLWTTASVLGQWIEPDVPDAAWLAVWVSHLRNVAGDGAIYALYANNFPDVLAAAVDAGDDAVFETLCQTLRRDHDIAVHDAHLVPALLAASRPEGWELVGKTLLAAQRQEGLRHDIVESIATAHPDALRQLLSLIRENNLARFTAVWSQLASLFGFSSVDRGGMVAGMTPAQIRRCLETACETIEAGDSEAIAQSESDGERLWIALWDVGLGSVERARELAIARLDDPAPEVRFIALQFLRYAMSATGDLAAKLVDDPDPQVADAAFWLVDAGWPTPGGSDQTDEGEDEDGKSKLPLADQIARFEAIETYLDRVPKKGVVLEPIVWPWTAWQVEPDRVTWSLLNHLGEVPPTRLLPHLDRLDTYRRSRVVAYLSDQKKWDNETREALHELAGDRSGDVAIAGIEALARKASPPDEKTNEPTDSRRSKGPGSGPCDLPHEEVELLEGLLTRSADALRRTVYGVLTRLPGDRALESGERLLASGKAPQRLAGLEILRQLQEAERFGERPREIAAAYVESKGKRKPSKAEQTQLDALLTVERAEDTVQTAFGLLDAANLTQPVAPKKATGKAAPKSVTTAATRLLQSLDDLVAQHAETEVKRDGRDTQLLGQMRYGMSPNRSATTVAALRKSMPLAELWEQWDANRPKAMRDADGMELIRAHRQLTVLSALDTWRVDHTKAWLDAIGPNAKSLLLGAGKRPSLKSLHVVGGIVDFLTRLHELTDKTTNPERFAFAAGVWESACASVDHERFGAFRQKQIDEAESPWERRQAAEVHWATGEMLDGWSDTAKRLWRELPAKPRKAAAAELWPVYLWVDKPPGLPASAGLVQDFALAAYASGTATVDDVLRAAVTPDESSSYRRFQLLATLTKPGLFDDPNASTEHALGIALPAKQQRELGERLDTLTGRLVELELARGEAATDAAVITAAVESVYGTDRLLALLTGLDKKGFARMQRYGDDGLSRRDSLTRLVKCSRPRATDTPEEFVAQARAAVKADEMPEDRLLELAFLAPVWVKFVEAYFERHGKWDGLAEGVYWLMAHMRGWGMGGKMEAAAEAEGIEAEESDDDSRSRRSGWDRLIGERTPISKEDRAAGAIDVAWFETVRSRLKPAKWDRLAAAARFADNAQQARRAKFVADTLAGTVERSKLVADITDRQLKDSVRLLGLLPLAKGAKREKDIRERHEVLAEYQKYARTLSGLTRPEAERAVGIGMDNLARLSGYPDPLRMQWALEAGDTAELGRGPVTVTEGAASFTVELDHLAKPQTTITRTVTSKSGETTEKPLKSLPKELKKHPRVLELKEQAKRIKTLGSRSRRALEEAMVRGDTFAGAELKGLAGHAVVWPMVSRLVLLGEGIAGYPDKKGRALRSHDGTLEPVKARETLRIAHPHDLLERGDWSDWQRECLQAERVQPFKQVFRELYPLTPAERKGGGRREGRAEDDHVSRRYAGQQVQPSQALALFGSRGWSTQDGIWKTDHREKITAEVYGELYHGSVAAYELPAIEGVAFRRVGEWGAMPLHEIPPRLFSETMRDVDLAVSVAHAGGVDPEATASTVEMRAALLTETCVLLGLDNVKVEPKKAHAVIRGHFGRYSVHLGSGTVHKLPGGSVCLVPVHSQHRGRLFLPFADDDPRTAEVMSKVLLLARDREIQDTVLLDQIR